MKIFKTIREYVLVAKPGIVSGNMIAAAGGFFLASRGNADPAVFLSAILGISLVIASACVFNNILDINMDRKMDRTRNRVMPRGLISRNAATFYGALLGMTGGLLLWVAELRLCLVLVLLGFAIYVGLYSLYLKRHSLYATVIGSLAGATPPLAGYCAVSNRFDMGALILLWIFSLWQIPHSYAIAIFRIDDYKTAAIPVLPIEKGIRTTQRKIFAYIMGFTAAVPMLTFYGYTGFLYLTVMFLLSISWLFIAWLGFRSNDDRLWAKRIFIFSILGMMVLSVMMAFDSRVPPSPAVKTLKVAEYSTSPDLIEFGR